MRPHRGELSMQMEERDRQAAFYRNVAGWASTGLGVLAFFWALSNSFQTQAVRVAAAVVGSVATLLMAALAVVTHWRPLGAYAPVMALAVLVANVAPAVFLLVAVLASGEYQFAQNKQPR